MASAHAPAPQPVAAAGQASSDPTRKELDVRTIVRELTVVADYISHIKSEIGALRANELCQERIPTAHKELGSVVKATASATNTIMAAAEDILGFAEAPLDTYRSQVESKMLEIFEACSFQDITGQRIVKVLETLSQVEKRLDRFARAVKARDSSDSRDPEESLLQARREMLLLNGPQGDGEGVNQDEIDSYFA